MYRLLTPRSSAAWCTPAGRLLLPSASGSPTGGCWRSSRPAHSGLGLSTRGGPVLDPCLLQFPAGLMHPPARSLTAVGGSSAPEKGPSEDCRKQTPDTVEEENKLTKTQQLKKVFKEYGAVGVAFHVGISLVSLGIFYMIISSGVDITALLLQLGFSEAVVHSKMAAGTSTFVLAYAVHKLFAPIRISITVMAVPFIVRYFRKIGFFKPPTP